MNNVELKILQTILTIFGVSGIFMITACIIKRKIFVEVWHAYAMGFVIVTSLLAPIYLGGIGLLVMLLLLGCRCTYEMTKTITNNDKILPDTILLSITCTTIAYFQNYQMMVAVFILFIVYIFIYFLWSDSIDGCVIRIISACYPGLFFYHFAYIACSTDSFRYTVFLYAIVEVNDATAYLVGKFCGKKKLWAKVSPNKTWEGCIAGICCAILTGFCLRFAMPELKPWQLITLVIMISVMGLIGDLVASKIKRSANVKDFSNIVGAQGGILDVLDSLIFTAPLFYYFFLIA